MTNGTIDQLPSNQPEPLSPEAAAAIIELFRRHLNERNVASGRRANTSMGLAAVYAAGGMTTAIPEGARILTPEEIKSGLDYAANPPVQLTPDQERRADLLVDQGVYSPDAAIRHVAG